MKQNLVLVSRPEIEGEKISILSRKSNQTSRQYLGGGVVLFMVLELSNVDLLCSIISYIIDTSPGKTFPLKIHRFNSFEANALWQSFNGRCNIQKFQLLS